MASGTISINPSNQPTAGLGGQDTITVSSVTAPVYTTDSIDLSMLSNTVIGSPYTVTTSLHANAFPGGFTAGTGWTTSGNTPWLTQSSVTPKINLDGEGADIVVNGESLIGMLHRIEKRLNILTPNPKLEAEWKELKQLGEQYRKLEQHIQDKQATWDRLRAMPPPEID